MDTAHAEALARGDGKSENFSDPGHGGALAPSHHRLQDIRTMDRPKSPWVLLAILSLRTTAKGNRYLSGWLGKASVVGFPGEPDEHGNETFNLYVSEPEPCDGAVAPATARTAP
jgi:hypothetical protein